MTDPAIRIDKESADHVEVSTRYGIGITVNLCSDQVVTLSKEYGPLIFTDIRIVPSFQTCEWIIERQRIDCGEWEEVARVDGQRDYEYDETHPLHKEWPQA